MLIVNSIGAHIYLASGAIAPIDTRARGRLARWALYGVRYRMARAKMVCAAPGVRRYKILQLARHVGARSEIAAARTMGVCAPSNLKIAPFSALEVSMGMPYLVPICEVAFSVESISYVRRLISLSSLGTAFFFSQTVI